MKIEILHRFARPILVSGEYSSLKDAIEKSRANLSYADLSDATLSGANLSHANFSGANFSDANLSCANLSHTNLSDANLSYADLSDAELSHTNLSDANLSYANLSDANLSYVTLSDANLSHANLSGADLSGANLSGANLFRANLSGTKGINPYLCTPLLMLLDMPVGTLLRAYKLVNEKWEGLAYGGVPYKIGIRVKITEADTDPSHECGAGINVATLDWCMREWKKGYRILCVEFRPEDIACIPTATDGRFRLIQCVPISEVDLKKIGLIKEDACLNQQE